MAKTKRRRFDLHIEPLIRAVGLERVIDAVGIARVVDAVGMWGVIEEKGIDWVLAQLSPEQRRQLKAKLK